MRGKNKVNLWECVGGRGRSLYRRWKGGGTKGIGQLAEDGNFDIVMGGRVVGHGGCWTSSAYGL